MCAAKVFSLIIQGSKVSICHRSEWYIDETGIYMSDKADKKSWIASPVWVNCVFIPIGKGAIKVSIKGIHLYTNQVFEVVTHRSNLHPEMNNPLLGELINQGMDLQQGANKKLLDFLSKQKDMLLVHTFDKLGWHTDEDKELFVLPSQVLGNDQDKNYDYMPDSDSPSQMALKASGTLEEWQQHVVSTSINNPIALFALGVAFAAPLMRLFRVDGGCFHFWCVSSRGKTLLLQIAASVFGNAADPAQLPDGSLIQRWNTTANALEGTALAFNDLLLPMDELGTSSIKNFGQAIYQLAGGTGKQAMNANRDIRPQRAWRTLIISSGEHAISHEVEATTGAQARTGQLIRFIDISVDNIFPAWGDIAEAKKNADALKVACSQYYGVAALPFLEYVVKIANSSPLMNEWLERFELIENALAEEHADLQPEQRRAIKRFALVACGLMMATESGCIAIDDETIMTAARHVLSLWLADFPTVSEADRGVEHLKQFILSNPSRFGVTKNDDGGGHNLVGFKDDANKRYIIFKDKMANVCGRPNIKPVVKRLDELNYLNHNDGRKDLKWRGATVYAVYFSIFDEVYNFA